MWFFLFTCMWQRPLSKDRAFSDLQTLRMSHSRSQSSLRRNRILREEKIVLICVSFVDVMLISPGWMQWVFLWQSFCWTNGRVDLRLEGGADTWKWNSSFFLDSIGDIVRNTVDIQAWKLWNGKQNHGFLPSLATTHKIYFRQILCRKNIIKFDKLRALLSQPLVVNKHIKTLLF